MIVNQCWQKDYTDLVEKTNFYKMKLRTSEDRVKVVEEENEKLRQRLLQLENQSVSQTATAQTSTQLPNQTPVPTPFYSIDDIEALKQQVYM